MSREQERLRYLIAGRQQPPRISREYLNDARLARAIGALRGQMGALGALEHRFQREGEAEAALAIGKDDDVLTDILALLLNEQRQRRVDDFELTDEPTEQES